MRTLRALLAENLATLRKARGLSQEALAELVETSHVHLSRLENGKHWPSDEMLDALAKALKVAPAQLFHDAAAEGVPAAVRDTLVAHAKACGFELVPVKKR